VIGRGDGARDDETGSDSETQRVYQKVGKLYGRRDEVEGVKRRSERRRQELGRAEGTSRWEYKLSVK
jgi:hypothetical protein